MSLVRPRGRAPAGLPPVDLDAPAVFETATFALG
jgi:hypothetical protein